MCAPRAERFPPHTLRVTTAGRKACSARQLVASIASRLVDEDIELILQMATCDRDPMRGDRAGAIAVAHAQRTLQQRLDARREVALVLIADERPTPTQQMRDTGLMHGLSEAAVRRPAITDHDPCAPQKIIAAVRTS